MYLQLWLANKMSRSDLAVKLIKFQPYNSLETYQKDFIKHGLIGKR